MKMSLDASLLGLQRGQHTIRKAASEVARSGTIEGSGDLAKSLVKLKLGRVQAQASATALSIELGLVETLLDIRV